MSKMKRVNEDIGETSFFHDIINMDSNYIMEKCAFIKDKYKEIYSKCTRYKIKDSTSGCFSIKNSFNSFTTNLILKITIPEIKFKEEITSKRRIRWCRNLAHNLFKEIEVKIGNTKHIIKLDPILLDFVSKFEQSDDYFKLIGNKKELIDPTSIESYEGFVLPKSILYLPLPINRYKDYIPTLDSEIIISFTEEDLMNLLIIDDFATGKSIPVNKDEVIINTPVEIKLIVETIEMFLKDRKKINEDHVLLNHFISYQSKHKQSLIMSFDLKSTHDEFEVEQIFFGSKNMTNKNEHSNYSNSLPRLKTIKINEEVLPNGIDFYYKAQDLIADFKLYHAELLRTGMNPQAYADIFPFLNNRKVVDEPGYHCFFYNGVKSSVFNDQSSIVMRLLPNFNETDNCEFKTFVYISGNKRVSFHKFD